MTTKIILGILIVSVLIVGLGAIGFVALNKQPPSTSVATTPSPTTVPPPQPPQPPAAPAPYASSTTGYIYKTSYPSLDGRFTLDLYTYPVGDPHNGVVVCRFKIVDNTGHEYDAGKSVGTDITSGCDPEGGNDFWHYFGGWVDGDKFVMPGVAGEIRVIDPQKLTVETYQYDASSLNFIAVSRSMKYWLFSHDAGAGDLSILDQNRKVVLSGLTSYRSALYDTSNDGFVLMAIDQVSSSTDSLKLDYLPVSNLKLRNVLTSDPFTPAQRDTEPPRLSSKPGEIIYDPGFGGLDAKYFGSDGRIHLKL